MKARPLLPCLAMVALGGCGTSPRTHFFALDPVAGDEARRTAPFRVQVAAVHLPPSLDRRQMVRMSGDNRVTISETDRWSAPLDEMVRNVLTEDLAERLPAGTVILPEAPTPAGTRIIVVTMTRFGPDAAGDVQLRGSWTLVDGRSNTPIMDRDVRVESGRAATPDGTGAAMSRGLAELASEIASGLGGAELSERRRRGH